MNNELIDAMESFKRQYQETGINCLDTLGFSESTIDTLVDYGYIEYLHNILGSVCFTDEVISKLN